MGERSKILLFFLTLIFVGVILMIVALISTDISTINQTNVNEEEVNTEEEVPKGNLITIHNQDGEYFTFVAITDQDTLAIYQEDGEKINANIEKRGWEGLKVSPDLNVFSAIGDRNLNSRDLALYDIRSRKFGWYTDFSRQENGITQYGWLNDQTLYFHQGVGPEEWFHTFFYPSQLEIKKQFRSNNLINFVSEEFDRILYYNQSNYFLTDLNGSVIWELTSLRDFFRNQIIITNLLLMEGSDKFVFVNEIDGVLVKAQFEDNVVRRMKFEPNTYTPVCSINENELLARTMIENGEIKITRLNILDEEIMEQYNFEFDKPDLTWVEGSFDCDEQSTLFAIDSEEGRHWFTLVEGEFKELQFLYNFREVKYLVRPTNEL